MRGCGCEQSVANGTKLIFVAAQKGEVDAYESMGTIYRDGITVPPSLLEAEKWFNKATEKGRNCNPLVVAMYEKSADSGNEQSIRMMIRICEKNLYDARIAREKYYSWVRAIADTGDAKCCYVYGKALMDGTGVPKNPESAIRYLVTAAESNYPQASYELGVYYYNGAQFDQATKYLVDASSKGMVEANLVLGTHFYEKHDYRNAVLWLSLPASRDMGDSILMIADSYDYLGDYPNSASYYSSIVQRLSDEQKIHVAQMYDYKIHDYQRAAELYKSLDHISKDVIDRLLKIYEDYLDDPIGLASIYEIVGTNKSLADAAKIYESFSDYESAIRCYTSYVSPNSGDRQLIRHIAEIYDYKLNDAYSALEWYSSVTDPRSSEPDLCLHIAELYEQTGQFHEAIQWYSSMNPSYCTADTLLHMAELYEGQLDDPRSAVDLYTRVITPRDRDTDAVLHVGELYERSGDYRRAAKWYEDMRSDEGKLRAAEVYRTELYQPMMAAELYMDCARSTYRGSEELYIKAAQCYEDCNAYDKVAEIYYDVGKDNRDEELLLKAANIYRDRLYNDRRYSEIIEYLAEYCNSPDAMFEMGKMCESRGDRGSAKEWYRKASNYGNWEAQDCLDRLERDQEW